MTIKDGANKLYRDSKIGFTVSTVLGLAAAALTDWLTTLPALAAGTVTIVVGNVIGAITAWKSKHVPSTETPSGLR